LQPPEWGANWAPGYSWYHNGDDIADPSGAPVHAAQAGEVLFANWTNTSFGFAVTLNHCLHISTLCGHMQRLSVTAGQYVQPGDIIGFEGQTGWTLITPSMLACGRSRCALSRGVRIPPHSSPIPAAGSISYLTSTRPHPSPRVSAPALDTLSGQRSIMTDKSFCAGRRHLGMTRGATSASLGGLPVRLHAAELEAGHA
jgi:hypothetical protein